MLTATLRSHVFDELNCVEEDVVRTDHNCLLHDCHNLPHPLSRAHHLSYYNLHQTEIRICTALINITIS